MICNSSGPIGPKAVTKPGSRDKKKTKTHVACLCVVTSAEAKFETHPGPLWKMEPKLDVTCVDIANFPDVGTDTKPNPSSKAHIKFYVPGVCICEAF